MAKANHKHQYQKHIVYRGGPVDGPSYDVVNVCAVCGFVRPLPFKERLKKTEHGYLWICRLETIREVYGDLPTLE